LLISIIFGNAGKIVIKGYYSKWSPCDELWQTQSIRDQGSGSATMQVQNLINWQS